VVCKLEYGCLDLGRMSSRGDAIISLSGQGQIDVLRIRSDKCESGGNLLDLERRRSGNLGTICLT
jgi:hypothetical protein